MKPIVYAFIGARPNLPKAATVQRAFVLPPLRSIEAELSVIHMGQHDNPAMGLGYVGSLGLEVDNVLSSRRTGSDSGDLAELITSVGSLLASMPYPDLLIVFGDVNSTVAAALVGARNGLPVVHVEAGLRSFSPDPEEVNRKVVTACADFHFVPSARAYENLTRENIPQDDIYFVGNAHTESFLMSKTARSASSILQELSLSQGSYILFSVHKPTTLSNAESLGSLVERIATLPNPIWVMHPHTTRRLQVTPGLLSFKSITYLDPIPYNDFGKLLENAAFVVTDSAGLQEECTVAGVPCITVGAPTARPETVYSGTNLFAGYDLDKWTILARALLEKSTHPKSIPDRWDTQVSARISQALFDALQRRREKVWLLR
jgi:UDP-N-acetylglucosamine 2-epimerase (non-hydrolysing)